MFYLGLALLLTHELDAMRNNEWQVLPVTAHFPSPLGEDVFVWLHVPLFAISIGCIASLRPRLRSVSRIWVAAFLVIHGGLHWFFSGQPEYEFASLQSSFLIYGASVCGTLYLLAGRIGSDAGA